MKSLCWIQYLLTDESRIKEEDLVPQVFTKQLLLVAAFNQKRVNYGSERKGLVKKMSETWIGPFSYHCYRCANYIFVGIYLCAYIPRNKSGWLQLKFFVNTSWQLTGTSKL